MLPSARVEPMPMPAPGTRAVNTFHAPPQQACAPLPFDPAGHLFSAYDRFDPPTHYAKNPDELAVLQPSQYRLTVGLQAALTPEERDAAVLLAEVGIGPLWMLHRDALAQGLSPEKAALVKTLFNAVELGAILTAEKVKGDNREPRPFQASPEIVLYGKEPGGSSYPSGHATTAYAMAYLCAALDPANSERYFREAANVARSRVALGVHFSADVAAGSRLGIEIARTILEQHLDALQSVRREPA